MGFYKIKIFETGIDAVQLSTIQYSPIHHTTLHSTKNQLIHSKSVMVAKIRTRTHTPKHTLTSAPLTTHKHTQLTHTHTHTPGDWTPHELFPVVQQTNSEHEVLPSLHWVR